MADKTKNTKAVVTVSDKASDQLKRIRRNFKSFKNSTKEFGSSLKSLGALSFAPMAVGFATLGAVVKSSIKSFADYSSSVKDVSIKTGVATETLQKLRYAASQSGSSAQALDGALGIFSKNLANAVQGKNKQMVETFKKLGISMKNANGEWKTASELMPEVADAMKRQNSQTQKAYIANQMFGKSGLGLIQTFEQGSEGLKQLGNDAEKFGLVLAKDDVLAAANFNDALGRTKLATQGLQNSIGKKLIPILRPLVDNFNEWIATNREWLATTIGDAVKDLVEQLKQIDFKKVAKTCMEFVKSSVKLFNALGGLKTIGAVIATIFGAKLVIGIASTVSAFGSIITTIGPLITSIMGIAKAIGVVKFALISSGIGALIVGIGLLAAYVITHWDECKVYFVKFWDTLKNLFSNQINSITTIFNDILEIPNLIINGEWGKLGDVFKNIYSNIFLMFFAPFKAAATFLCDVLPDEWIAKFDSLVDYFKGLFEKIKNFFFAPFEKAMAGIQTAVDKVKGITNTVTSGISGAYNSTKSFFGFGDSTPQFNPMSTQQLAYATGEMSGDLNIKVTTDGNTQAEVETSSQNNLNMNVQGQNGRVR